MSLSRKPRCGPPGKMQSEQSGVPTRVQTSSKGSRLPFLATTGNSASEYPSIPFAPDLNNLIYHRRHFRIIKQSCSFSRNGRKHDLSRVYISHRRQVLSSIHHHHTTQLQQLLYRPSPVPPSSIQFVRFSTQWHPPSSSSVRPATQAEKLSKPFLRSSRTQIRSPTTASFASLAQHPATLPRSLHNSPALKSQNRTGSRSMPPGCKSTTSSASSSLPTTNPPTLPKRVNSTSTA